MRHARRLLLLALIAVLSPGCDIALGVYFATKKSSSSSSSSSPDPRYRVYAATLTPGSEPTEKINIKDAGGKPGANWKLLGAADVSADFAITETTNSILIQTTVAQNYEIDAVEAFDANGHLVGTFTTGNVFSDQVSDDDRIPNRADGVAALAAGTKDQKAFAFQILPTTATPIVRVRVYLKAENASATSGDPIYVGGWGKVGDQDAGGAAVNSLGTLFVGAIDVSGRAMWLAPFNQAGVLQAANVRNMELDVAVSEGSIAVAVDLSDNVIVANTSTLSQPAGTSSIRVRKFDSTVTIPATNDTGLAGGRNRVEAHGVAVDDLGNIIVAAGNDVGTLITPQINHWLRKYTPGLLEIWTQSPPADVANTWWRAVAMGPSNSIATSGDFTSSLLGPIDILSRKTDAGNASTTDAVHIDGGPGGATDLGYGTAVDNTGNTYVGGSIATTGGTPSPILLKIPNGSTTPASFFSTGLNLPGEILGIATLPDGTVYATGYETVSTPSQGKNLILLKISSGGTVLWKQTYDSALGDDRGVSVVLTSAPTPRVIVVGQAPTASNGVDILVIAYAQ